MAICNRCNNNINFWAGGVNKQTGLCRKCQQEVRIQTLVNIRNGNLPQFRPSIHLDTDEVCHLEVPAVYHKQNAKSVSVIPGRIIATSKKLHFLASTHTYTIGWNNVLRAQASQQGGLYLELTRQGGTGHYTNLDGEYAAAVIDTLTRMAKRQIVGSNGGDAIRQIPQDVKTAVWQRDGGKCRQCGAQQYLEFDHIIPFSRGGASSVNNVQLLCRQCNQKKGARI